MKSKFIFFLRPRKDSLPHGILPTHTISLTAMVQFYYPYKGALMWINKIKGIYR